uniref:Uncharacterized protein n=1 Tax=Rhizophagus irregularis (strain DAOM 181602 / DAOM 197198 / MUCL 43194) TaxID=747089 RepID=U9UL86_RHIID
MLWFRKRKSVLLDPRNKTRKPTEKKNLINLYFESTPISEWSYMGFLEALKTNCVSEVRSLADQKSIWRKRYLTYLSNVLIEKQDSISKERATFLIQQYRVSFLSVTVVRYCSSRKIMRNSILDIPSLLIFTNRIPPEEENFWNNVKTEKDLMVKETSQSANDFGCVLIFKDIFNKQSQIDALNVLEVTCNQKCEEYVDKINSRSLKREELAEEDITQEDVLNSVFEVSDTFRKTKFPVYYEKLKSIWHTRDAKANYYIIDMGDEETLNQVHKLLSDNELNFLSERLSLTDENECISTEAHRYMILFDEIIEESNYDDDDIEGENNDITD